MKKVLTLALLAALLLQSAACGAQPAASTDTTVGSDDTTTAEPVETAYDPQIEAVDLGGKKFGILTREIDDYSRRLDDISAESENGNVLNDEIYRRNAAVMEKYNTEFEITISANVSNDLKTSVLANDGAYEIAFNGLAPSVVLAAEDVLMDLSELPHVDLTQDYWSQQIMDDCSIMDKYYVGVSDLTTQAYFAAGIVYFNKTLANQAQIEDPYELVLDGKWTFDKMVELCRDVSRDLDGDSKLTEKDQYGITYNNFAWQIMFYGSGETFVKKQDDGTLALDTKNTRLIEFVQKLMPSAQDTSVTLYSENFGHLGGSYRIDVCQNAFNESRALFWLEAMYGVPTLREMENDFGILPVPKADENQENYASFIHYNHASSVIVPVTTSDPDVTGRILEDLTYRSQSVREAFIETTLKGKYARDNESAEMIDIIIGNIRTDYGLLLSSYGISLDKQMRSLLNQGSTDIVSMLAQNEENWNALLTKYYDTFAQ